MKPLALLKTGSTFPDLIGKSGDFEQWFCAKLSNAAVPVNVIDIAGGEPPPDRRSIFACIITGSHAMVTDRCPWSERLTAWLARAVQDALPILGVCYGHQTLADACGGVVGKNPRGLSYGNAAIQISERGRADPLFSALPSQFAVHVSHEQSVLQPPARAVILARSPRDPYHAFRIGDCAWGVQFHPEFDAAITAEYIRRRAPDLEAQHDDPENLLTQCVETPEPSRIVPLFLEIALARSGKKLV